MILKIFVLIHLENNVNMCKFYESLILFQILKIFVETFLPVWLLNLLAGHKYLVLAELLKGKELERFLFGTDFRKYVLIDF